MNNQELIMISKDNQLMEEWVKEKDQYINKLNYILRPRSFCCVHSLIL